MDPQSQSFTPYSTNNDTWRLQADVERVQQVQAEHAERLTRIERRQEEDARVKSVWGSSSPFPSVLSGTPQQAPVQQPPSDQFRGFDDEAINLMSSLHLDAEDEPRRAMGANSRANSVRFDESANQNHFSHSSRASLDFMSRTSSGLGGLQMTERTTSHKSDGRASSAHSMRSAASGRASSLNLESGFSLGDSNTSPVDTPALAPGLLLLGFVPAIVRCWMNTNFKHDALLYAAVCTGSYKSYLGLRLIQKLGFEASITSDEANNRTVHLPVYFPEAVTHPASSRSSSPAPQLPTLTVRFQVVDQAAGHETNAIQIYLGSDILRAHSADILFSSNSMTLFDDDRSKLSIPLVRPEDEGAFKGLYVSTGSPHASQPVSKPVEAVKEILLLNGHGNGSSAASASSSPASPLPGKYRPPGVLAAISGPADLVKLGATGSDIDVRPASRASNASRPSLTMISTSTEVEEVPVDAGAQTTPLQSASSPAIWGSWRRDGGASSATSTPVSSSQDWAGAGRTREASYQRKESGIKVLKPKTASRTFSTSATVTAAAAASPGLGDGKSRFFDEGRRRSGADTSVGKPAVIEEARKDTLALSAVASGGRAASASAAGAPKTKANPIGGGSAFSWLNPGGGARAAAHVTTASSSSKKRRLAPFDPTASDYAEEVHFDQQGLQAHTTSSPSSSPRPPSFTNTSDSNSQAPSPPSSVVIHNTSPPRTLPAHIHEEVLLSKEAAGGQAERGASPSGQFAAIQIGGEVMVGEEHGGNGNEQRGLSSPQRVLGARSASPAKRTAADMEDAGAVGRGGDRSTLESVPGSFVKVQDGGPTDFDQQMRDMAAASTSTDTQESTQHSAATSAPGTSNANSSATSLKSEGSPSQDNAQGEKTQDFSTAQLDQQVASVQQALDSSLEVGQKGVVVSGAWLGRVLSRTSEGLKSGEYSKNAREGPIGPIDNSSIVSEGAFDGPHLSDAHGGALIQLLPGLSNGDDFQVLPNSVWGSVVALYGMKPGQHQINRYAIDTAPAGSPTKNVVHDMYPIIITIRKVPHPSQESERPPTPCNKSLEVLHRKREQRAQDQMFPDDAVRLVASRSDRFLSFLNRSKEAAGISRSIKVKLWRVLDPHNVAVDRPETQQGGVLSSPTSRATSPSKTVRAPDNKLILPLATFNQMEIGRDMEHIDAKDETDNDKYNGSSTLETHGFFADQTILLEEQIGGPAGGEFASDSKKAGAKPAIAGKKNGSKAGSTATSRGTSPAPGGMLTRGRARKDGRTRGVVGLSNLGNTCYMNSALQCIRSVEELTVFFSSNKYKRQINASNPLGHGGTIARQYAGVITGIYGEHAGSSFSPSEFKRILGKTQPLFSGYGQQDSQEFLSFLVDALHEDLNRIEKKPYIENPDSDDKTVHDPQAIIELGETYRSNHKARNDSICMDLFGGFYKNKMECPVCDKVSVTFDPYSLLTVQLPVDSTFQHSITFVPLHGAPINHAIDIDRNATIKALKEHIASKHPGVTADRLWMAEVYSHKLYKVFENHKTLAEDSIQPGDHIFVFELDGVPKNLPDPAKARSSYGYSSYNSGDKAVPGMDSEKADRFAVPVFSRRHNRHGSGWDIVMHPLYVTLGRKEAQDFEIILKKVLIAVSRQTSRAILTELGDEQVSDGSTADGAPEKEESASEDSARVSDRSVPSEDGYVDVSFDKSDAQAKAEDMADAPSDPLQKAHPIPSHFMDPQYYISPTLRNNLFALNYARSSDGMLCASMSSIENSSVGAMFDRVKRPVRRSSTESISEESTTSAATGPVDGETEESDADDDENRPDIIIGGDDARRLQTPTSTQSGSEDELPANPLQSFAMGRNGRHRKNKHGSKRKQKTYSRKDRNTQRQPKYGSGGLLRSTQSHHSLAGKSEPQGDESYYIKLGEAIVIDWLPEALDGLFGGDCNIHDEFRGHWLSTDDGKGLDFLPDPALEQLQERRKLRKKNGITLEDCFVETGKREILSEDNAWYCNRCKEMRQAAKTLEIWTIPDILIVHLKRFGGNRTFRDKIDVLIDYPIEGLDMTKKVGFKEDGKEYLYDLFAVDNHFGGLGGGHYTAMAKSFYDGQWYDYNDSMSTKLGDAKRHSAAVYLLFYRRRSDTPLGPQYLQDLVTQARNPSSATESPDADEDDSGEGKLGGTIPSLRGSSGALVVAGAGPTGSGRSIAASGSAGAGSILMTKTTSTRLSNHDNEDDEGGEEPHSPLGMVNGVRIAGPVRPPHMLQYGSQGTSSWGFSTLEDLDDGGEGQQQPAEADDPATDNLLHHIGSLGAREADPNEDVASNFAEGDADDAEYSSRMDEFAEDDDYGGPGGFMQGSDGRASTPIESFERDGFDYDDEHGAYPSVHRTPYYLPESSHVEHAGVEFDDSPPAEELHLSDDVMGEAGSHDKEE
ncbi:hypothetical protein LTR87_007109 [Friedmanniomyces endolithicus]|nr:hypothetical protein LTR87_007109 [Friedmanniomyces endolithicus]